jgi:hypothetical protein
LRNFRVNLEYNKMANSQCRASSREINSLENVSPGKIPRFLIH